MYSGKHADFIELVRSILRYFRRHPLILFLLWALWLGAEYVAFGTNSYVRIHDNGDDNLPARLAMVYNLKEGLFGFWASQWGAGTDRFAQAFTNDLTAIPFLFLPGWLAYGLVMIAQRFLAGYFTFRLLRDELDVTEGASVYAGLAFALFAQNALNRDWAGFTLYQGFAIPGVPLVLWLLSRLERQHRFPAALLAASVGALLAVSSSIHMTLFVVPIAVFWFWFIVPRRSPRFWMLFALFAAVWIVVTFLDVLPILKNGALSNRAAWNANIIWSQLSKIIGVGILVRDNFVPLSLGVLGLVAARWHDRRLAAAAGAICFCLAVAAFSDIVVGHLRSVLGFLYGFNWGYIKYLVPFLAITFAAIGISQLQSWRVELAGARSRHSVGAATLVIYLVVAALFVQSLEVKRQTLEEMLNGSNFRALYLNSTLQQLSAQHHADLHSFRVATISLGNTDPPWPPAAAWAYGFDSADAYMRLQSLRYREFWEQVIQPLTERDPAVFNWVHSWGNQLYLFAPSNGFPQFDAVTPAPVDFDKYYRLNLLTLANVRYIISPIPLVHSDLALVPSAIRDDQIAWSKRSHRRRLVDMLFQRAPGRALYVYENRLRLPRAFCAPSAQAFADRQQLLSALSQATLAKLRSSALFESSSVKGFSIDMPVGSQPGQVSAPKYSRDMVALEIQAESPCALVLTDSYSPYWKAQLDGEGAKLLPVDVAFQGLIVPAGNHQLVLKYSPPYALH